jgi:hypothetical protein
MANERLTAEYWKSKDEIINAAVHGWNPLQRLPSLLREAYPDLKGIDFGFFSESDLPEMHSQGWELMGTDLFDPEQLNKVLPARFGLTTDSGSIKWRDNYLMIMGKDFRKRLRDARNRYSEDNYRKSIQDKKYTSPQDPRRDEMEKYAESTLESKVVQPKRGPGRPPKQ